MHIFILMLITGVHVVFILYDVPLDKIAEIVFDA